jgi:hypothetical protein
MLLDSSDRIHLDNGLVRMGDKRLEKDNQVVKKRHMCHQDISIFQLDRSVALVEDIGLDR